MPYLPGLPNASTSAQPWFPSRAGATRLGVFALSAFVLLTLLALVAGCGSGGYAGGGILGLSLSSVTIDAGQSFSVTSTVSGGAGVQWTLSGPNCTGSACGTVSPASGASTTYTAPPGLAAPLGVTLTASVPGTRSTSVVGITVNPDPVISGTPPAGVTGVAYSATLTAAGGTAPLHWSLLSGTLPAGLSFNAATGVISGTPTAVGTSTFTVQAVDSSYVPYTVTASETIPVTAPLLLTGSTPTGRIGTPYSGSLAASGGTAPYTFSLAAGTLPAGLALSPSGAITGTPTAVGTSTFTAQVQDAAGNRTTGTFAITVVNALALTTSSLPGGTVGVPYSATIGVTGGVAPYTCAFTAGTLPAGLSLSGCVVSGTPTVAGTSSLTVRATDSGSPAASVSGPESIVIAPAPLALTTGTLPNGTVGVAYSSTIGVSGGTSPYACVVTGGTLPAGLVLGPNCLVSGTPTVAGTSSLTVRATDSSNPALTTTGPVSITIGPGTSLTVGNPPAGTVGAPYTGPIPVGGGTGPYTCTLTGGTLPAGVTLTGCTLTGTPTVPGSTTVTIGTTDSGQPPKTGSGPVTVTINPATLAITTGTLPNGTVGVAYSSTIGVSGGTAPYACAFTSGTLPAGLVLGPNCLVSGTPTVAGTSNLTVRATDSGNPTQTASGPIAITIVAAPTLVISSPPSATVGAPYSGTIPVTGGMGPYTCKLTAGALPAGLSLSGCVVTGTPITAGSTTVTVQATDSGSPATTSTGPVTLVVNPAPLAISTGTLPNGTVGMAYSSTIGVTGGTAPYTCQITGGTLPSGLALGPNCLVSGTPTVAGTSNLTVKATDSSNPALTTTGPVALTINPATTLTVGNPPAGTVGAPYTGPIPITGGTGPYACTVTAGTLPPGLILGANCTLTGTPTAPGTTPVTIGVTDSGQPPNTGSGTTTITINPATPVLTLGNPPVATVGTPYTGIIPVAGGTGPYTCTATGAVPAGLTLTNCTLTGTPTTAGSSTLTVTATDSSNPKGTVTGPVVVTVQPIPALSFTGSLPNGVVGVPYTQTLAATGGVGPYTYTLTAGTLPAGLTLSQAGVVGGTPTTPGASSFTVTATDSEGTPQTAALPLVLLVTYPTTATDGELKGPYAFLFQGYDDVAVGLFAFQTATVGSFTADGTGVISAGELDSNHQGSNPAGATVASNAFVGTYTLGADSRGSLTLTTLNADGTVGASHTYAIAVKPPVAPATTSAQGSLIEFDSNQVAGTRGSGTLLQQTTTAFAGGLTGPYAFGLQGDTPCAPTCTIALTPGPVAAVGQFTVSAGTVAGAGDSNIAATQIVNQTLSGSAGTADGNGRLPLSLATAGTLPGVYPSDYAVYVVNANQALVMSTDKHSAAILLAGQAQSQTLPTFGATSLTGPLVGYENSPTNPGLVGSTLNTTTNFSTATIFRDTADGAGTCTVTNVDVGGATALVNGVSGQGSGAPVINALLGTYQSTGPATCLTAGNGRVVLNYPVPNTVLAGTLGVLGLADVPPPARIVYLTGVDRGFFLETGYAGLGQIEPQSGQPYTIGSFTGSFVYGEVPASSVATTNTSGVIVANGQGSATSTQDLNVGVGTVNLLQLGVVATQPYTAPDPTTGRFTLNTTLAVYEISPGRFVLVDTSPLTTSPSVILLY